MLIKLHFFCFVLMILTAFSKNKFFSMHFMALLIAFKLSKIQRKNYDCYYMFALWIYKIFLYFFIKNNPILWAIYDLLCIFLGVYYLSKALKFLFCK